MKYLFAFALMASCFVAFATSAEQDETAISEKQASNFSHQWGQDALNFSRIVASHSAESLGINIQQIPQTTTEHSISNEESYLLNDGAYRFSSMQTNTADENISHLNAGFSSGNFSAETGLISNSQNLLASSHFYLQGAYNIFDGERFNLSLTAKFEAINNDAINLYFGDSYNLNADNSLFEQQATNATISLLSTYSINKKWKILGLISSTSLDKKIESSPLIDSNNIHVALIGTSYSF